MESFSDCISILKSDFEKCPGKYCGRVVLDSLNCTFSSCQVIYFFYHTI
jgi:hypothetical protein